ncbi:hypothetical protein F5X68DRAFT_239379 [Plectosphaerella plurivora]|uniref:Uncharacterized protein n=1 Tax=Plectosphaerella plurivora TaxID=936078 RepID=A0A9P8VEG0_9PEZI|nr:hypothetical protein F5X68DRAFT_239379 [Plectosphaerella plurivora]
MGDDPSGAPMDIDNWLRKMPDLKKAIQEDMEATQQSVDDKVRDLQANIDSRAAEVASERRRLATERLDIESLRLEWQRRKKAVYTDQLRAGRLQTQIDKDRAQIELIKSQHQTAESRLRKVEEGLNSLNGMMRHQPTTDNPQTSKRPAEDEPSGENAPKRQRGPDTAGDNASSPGESTTFEAVYAGGRPLQDILRLNRNKYVVLACSEHGIKFTHPSFNKACNHAAEHHPHLITRPKVSVWEEVLGEFGVTVLGCQYSQIDENNEACGWSWNPGITE